MNAAMSVPRFVAEGRVRFENRPIAQPGPGELLIRVRANALCGSDRTQFLKGSQITPGHEATGVVAATGLGTKTVVGTPGAIFLMDFCGGCRSCRLGLTNQCLAKRADMGFTHDGGYSISRARRVHPDIQSVAVLGAGPIGLGVLAMAKLILGKDVPVVVSDIIDFRLKLAEDLGGIPATLPICVRSSHTASRSRKFSRLTNSSSTAEKNPLSNLSKCPLDDMLLKSGIRNTSRFKRHLRLTSSRKKRSRLPLSLKCRMARPYSPRA